MWKSFTLNISIGSLMSKIALASSSSLNSLLQNHRKHLFFVHLWAGFFSVSKLILVIVSSYSSNVSII